VCSLEPEMIGIIGQHDCQSSDLSDKHVILEGMRVEENST
jgi:hypothetical protein